MGNTPIKPRPILTPSGADARKYLRPLIMNAPAKDIPKTMSKHVPETNTPDDYQEARRICLNNISVKACKRWVAIYAADQAIEQAIMLVNTNGDSKLDHYELQVAGRLVRRLFKHIYLGSMDMAKAGKRFAHHIGAFTK